jgi:misacylated tRNA(Ala) deacylase
MESTKKLYLQDDHCFEAEATVQAVHGNSLALDRTCFYPGGGGQPPDEGSVTLPGGELLRIASVFTDQDDVIWHQCTFTLPLTIIGQRVKLTLNKEKRRALARYHTVLHVLNTIVWRDYAGWITGAQIAVDYARIDFKLEGFSAALCSDLEGKVNAILEGNHPLRSYYIPEAEFNQRADLRRTLEVKPPISNGQVRVVAIEGFDAQACGGTHVHNTSEVGRFSIYRTENKGKNNKRLYVRLERIITD